MQSSYTWLAKAVHSIDERLARWPLMCHDRSSTDCLPLTHEFMSTMLSVRRPSVTTAIHVLAGNGFIDPDRGFVTVRIGRPWRTSPTAPTGKLEDEYRRLLGPL